jgi:hypothetical protein
LMEATAAPSVGWAAARARSVATVFIDWRIVLAASIEGVV